MRFQCKNLYRRKRSQQSWDFSPFPWLHESLQPEIIAVIESLEQLKESAEYELCGIVEQRPGVLDELAAERTKLLEKESAELEREAEKLSEEIKELSGETVSRIV